MRRMRALRLRLASLAFLGAGGALLTGGAGADEPKPLNHEWREIGTNHWQITTAPGESPEITDAAEGTRGTCSAGMMESHGVSFANHGSTCQRSMSW